MTEDKPIEDRRPNSLAARDIAYHVHAQTNLDAHLSQGPFTIVRGEGVRVFDDEGRRYLDALAGLWSASLGFSEKRLADAAYKQLCELPFTSTFAHRAHPAIIELAEALVSLAPAPLARALFANSGSEAVDTAVKLVWYYWNAHDRPEKKKIIARRNAYHGSTIVAASLTGLERMQREFDLPVDGIVRAPCPHYWKYAEDGESEESFAARMADEVEALVLTEGAETIGAFFAEPIQGAGGVILPPQGYFDRIQALCKKYDILFIADEVICGFGRTGRMWGSEVYDLKPDMMTCAKALSASYLPISALLVSENVFEALRVQSEKIGQFGHGFTYSGHPVCAAVALETLKIYQERDIIASANAVAPALQTGLRALEEHPLVGEVRGRGLLAGVELVEDKAGKKFFDLAVSAGALVQEEAKRRGLLIRALGDTLAFCPPLIISETEIAEILEGFAAALDAAHKKLRGTQKN